MNEVAETELKCQINSTRFDGGLNAVMNDVAALFEYFTKKQADEAKIVVSEASGTRIVVVFYRM
ncbi:hypothetical protein [Martelella soudanensis]|uniref:hypothetical protein n=1 Tax=Martelella sp. NC20 TaxID=2740298 RepID=UPI001AED9BEA|nr:hypothetical protein [Martelella sp. NC20]